MSPEKRLRPGLARELALKTGAGLNVGTGLQVARGRGSQGAGTRLAQRGGVCPWRYTSTQCTGIRA